MYAPCRILPLLLLATLLMPAVFAVPVPAGPPGSPGPKQDPPAKVTKRRRPQRARLGHIPGLSSFSVTPTDGQISSVQRGVIPADPRMPTRAPDAVSKNRSAAGFTNREFGIPGRGTLELAPSGFMRQEIGAPVSKAIRPGDYISFGSGRKTYIIARDGPDRNTFFLTDRTLVCQRAR